MLATKTEEDIAHLQKDANILYDWSLNKKITFHPQIILLYIMRLRELDTMAVETRAVDTRAVDTRAVDTRAVDARAKDARAVDTRAAIFQKVDIYRAAVSYHAINKYLYHVHIY